MQIIKKITFLLLVTLFTVSFFGCEKDCPVDEPASVTFTVPGVWTGTYTVDQIPGQPSLPFTFAFKADKTVITEGKGGNGVTYYSAGTWALSGTDITATYTTVNFPSVVIQSSKFTFKPTSDTLTAGTWKDVSGGVYTGKYSVMIKNK